MHDVHGIIARQGSGFRVVPCCMEVLVPILNFERCVCVDVSYVPGTSVEYL